MRAPILLPLLLALITAAPASGARVAFPQPFTASFDLTSSGTTIAETHWSLVPAGDGQFVYESRSQTVGFVKLIRDERIVERSEWLLRDNSLRSLSYRYSRAGRKPKEVAVAFDWERGMVSNTVRGDTWRMAIPEGTLDKLNYFLALMRDLREGADAIEYTVADGGKLKQYRFRREGVETIETALGPLEVVEVKRIREPDSRRETTLWCAPALGYLPVRARHKEKDGRVVVWQISSVEGL